MFRCFQALVLLLPMASAFAMEADPPVIQAATTVEVAKSPGSKWSSLATRTLADLPPLPADEPAGRFGGIGDPVETGATGFFRAVQLNGRWWFLDPEGRRYIHRGVTSVRLVRSAAAEQALRERFGSRRSWAEETARLLQKNGFNGTGVWTGPDFKPQEHGLAHATVWNFMSSYGKRRGGTYQKPGHTGYPSDCPFIFDKEFESFCREHARQIAATREDPWVLGHFTDNELPWHARMLDRFLSLPEGDQGRIEADRWLELRGKPPGDARRIDDADREAFVEHAAERYFSVVCKAIREQDPNHMILGARFHGPTYRLDGLFRAAGRHLDAVSVNYYHAWTPERGRLERWSSLAGKPILVSEWYAKAEDSGMANNSGAGWLVRTQQDRGRFYQNFTLALLESRVCPGWQWFRYADNDPLEKGGVASNRDSNKGIVNSRYEPYRPLLEAMGGINARSQALIRHFDGQAADTP